MGKKDKADIISKEADIVYKKIFILMAVAGAIGGFGLSIFDKASTIGLILLLTFLFLSFGIGFIVAGVLALIAYKKHWKIADYF